MAYKFQLGPASMSGSLEQDGNIDIEGSGELKMQGTTVIDASRNVSPALLKMPDVTSGKILVADGTSYQEVAVSGDVSIASSGAVTIANDAVEQAMIADDAVGADQLASNAVVNASIASGAAIDMDKLDGGSLAASLTDLADGDLMYAGDITDSNNLKSIAFGNLEDAIFGNVSSDATIAAGGALTIANDAVSLAKMAGLARGKFIVGDSSGNPSALALGTTAQFLVSDSDDAIWRTLSGDATLGADGALTIANDAVEQTMIADDAVGADQLAANAVVENSIVDNAVSLAKMANLARGSIILGDASGDPSALVKGGANTFLQSDGTDVAYVTLGGDATLSAGTLSIGATKVTDAMLNDDCANGLAGVGLVAASGIMALSLFELPGAAVNVAADSIAIVDADDTNISKKESIADLVAAMAGAGLKATAGVLSTESGTATAAGDADITLVEGMNYGSATLTADRTWSLPAAPSVGDIVHVKAPANLAGFDVTISKQGSHAIDGSATIELETAGAAVSLMYVAANTWVIF